LSRPHLSRSALRREVRKLALDLAQALMQLLERQGLWDEGALPTRAPGAEASLRPESEESRRVRRPTALLDALSERLVGALRHERAPVAISALARRLGTSPRVISHPLAQLVARGEVSKSGTRRGTRYALAAGRPKRGHTAARSGRGARKLPRKRKRRH
jgi:hypothetical protein